MSELQVLFPEPVVVAVGRRQVQIRPVGLADFELFGSASEDVLRFLNGCTPEGLCAYAVNARTLRRVLRRCTSLNRWALWRLPAPVALELMVQVMQVNAGFFGQALAGVASIADGPTSPSN
ncbi:hypothetical protein ACM792_08190 [Metapseudomonas otitidis]|uniref:hypothetical protein n=1 Tax=Metapseudomonas otitidis TaxID=319939 RepID=UPI0039FC570D